MFLTYCHFRHKRFDDYFSIFMSSSLHRTWYEKWGNVEIIVGIPLLIKAIILGIQNILEVLLEDIGILKMESIFLFTNITIILHSVLYVSLSYYIINPCISASSNFNGSFSYLMSPSNALYDNILTVGILVDIR